MKKKLLAALGLTAMLITAFSFSVFADDDDDDGETIAEVYLNCYLSDDADMAEGATYPEFEIVNDEELFDLQWENPSTEVEKASSAKTAKSFEITLTANDGYIFSSATNVSVTGVEEITSKKVKDDGDTLVIKVKAFVYWQLQTPDVESTDCFDNPTASKISFEKNGANSLEYYLIYTNSQGQELSKHGTTTSSSLSISSYTKDYDEDDEEDGYEDKVVLGIWLRALNLKDSSNPYIAPSDWVSFGEGDPDGDVSDYETWGEYINGKYSDNEVSQGTIGPNDTVASSTSSTPQGTVISSSDGSWAGSGTTWYYQYSSGSNATGWLQSGDSWFYLDPNQNGLMLSGWQEIDGYWYYFSQVEGSSYGTMLTGWQDIGGTVYFLRQVAGSNGDPMGSMLSDTTVSISGTNYVFDSTGALVSQY